MFFLNTNLACLSVCFYPTNVKTSIYEDPQSPKFKRVLLNETPKFPFWGLNISVDFDLRAFKKMENMKKVNK